MDKEKTKKINEIEREMMVELIKESSGYSKSLIEDVYNNGRSGITENTEGVKLMKAMSFELNEPVRKNRFVVYFPDEFKILPWTIKSIEMPIIEKRKCNDTIIVFRKFMSPLTSKTVSDITSKKNYKIKVKFLDASGVSVETWCIVIKKTISVDFGGYMKYGDDSVSEIKLVLKTKDCYLE